jgi:hypothetical protein
MFLEYGLYALQITGGKQLMNGLSLFATRLSVVELNVGVYVCGLARGEYVVLGDYHAKNAFSKE